MAVRWNRGVAVLPAWPGLCLPYPRPLPWHTGHLPSPLRTSSLWCSHQRRSPPLPAQGCRLPIYRTGQEDLLLPAIKNTNDAPCIVFQSRPCSPFNSLDSALLWPGFPSPWRPCGAERVGRALSFAALLLCAEAQDVTCSAAFNPRCPGRGCCPPVSHLLVLFGAGCRPRTLS